MRGEIDQFADEAVLIIAVQPGTIDKDSHDMPVLHEFYRLRFGSGMDNTESFIFQKEIEGKLILFVCIEKQNIPVRHLYRRFI